MLFRRSTWLNALCQRLQTGLPSFAPPPKPARRRRLSQRLGVVATVERRMQLSSVSVVAGQLSITLAGSESVQITASNGNLSVIVDGQEQATQIAAASVTQLVIQGGDGRNSINLMSVSAAQFPNLAAITINGGAGADQILGSPLPESIVGGDGNDWIYAGPGSDLLVGGTGNDTLLGGANADTLQGDDGNDTLRGQSGPDSLTGGAGTDTLIGSNTDTFNATDLSDNLLTESGDP